MAPHRLGRYTLLEELAQGGMSRVFVAQKDGADKICVLKQLLVELRTNEIAARRFYREAHIASFLDHPNIARLLDAGFEDDRFCLAMEYIPGADLETLLRALPEKRLPWELGITVALLVLDALAYAHDARDPDGKPLDVVHRDLAPRNVMIGFKGDVKLIDFGLARGKVDAFATEPGVIIGTLRYLSPEQARSDEVDRRSDLYSLGVVMHEMITGQRLVMEKTPLAVLRAIMEGQPPLMRAIVPTVPMDLEIAVARALEKQPRDRWPTASEMRSALLEIVGPSFAKEHVAELGQLVKRHFPDGERRAMELAELGRQRYASVYGGPGHHYTGTLSEAEMKHAARSGDEEETFALDRAPVEHLASQLDIETSTAMPKVAPLAPEVRPPRPTSMRAQPPRELTAPIDDDVDGDTIPIVLPQPRMFDPILPEPEPTFDGRVPAPPPPAPPPAPAPLAWSPAASPGLEEATAVSMHPQKRPGRPRWLVVSLVIALLLVIGALPLTLERCGGAGPHADRAERSAP